MADATALQTVTAEALLLDVARRVARLRDGFIAVHLHLSRLRPSAVRAAHTRIGLHLFNRLVAQTRAQVFGLANGDIMLVGRDLRYADVDAVVYRLRGLFAHDPLVNADAGDAGDRFATWYDLATDSAEFIEACAALHAEAARMRGRDGGPPAAPRSITPADLGDLLERLRSVDLAPFVRRQGVVRLDEGRTVAHPQFQEFYLSIQDLQRRHLPDVQITADPWLFLHLTRTLDRQMLPLIRGLDRRLQRPPDRISLNLGLDTVLSDAFVEAMLALGRDRTVVAEIRLVEVIQQPGAFRDAAAWLHDHGHLVLIDSLTTRDVQAVDLSGLDADLFKILWLPEMGDTATSPGADDARRAVDQLGRDRVVLARCDSEAAVRWGLAQGIRSFQGRFIDAMLGAVTMATCPNSAPCTLTQCVARRHSITAEGRQGCTNQPHLDTLPPLVPRPPGAAGTQSPTGAG